MADALVSALVQTILGNLNSLALREFEIASNLKTELQNLESTLSTIQAVLQDAEQKQWRSEAVKNWLRKLKEVAYDADDLLDEFAAKALRWKARKNMSSRVIDFFSSQNPIVFQFKKARELEKVRKRLDAVAKEKNDYHLTGRNGDLEIDDREWRLTSSLVTESEIFGRNEDKENIINRLFTSSTDLSDLSIYAICGMGGLGKTTLAQLVFNDERVERAFDFRIWVCVSDDFEVRRLTKAIIESVDGSPSDNKELDPLQRHLREKLRGKIFLLVLDDVWSDEKWDSLKEPLKVGAKGSMVMVTTRIEKVARIMATPHIYHLGYLSEDNSWLLFKQCSFLMESEAEYIKLERIGKQIVQKCGGVPLAVKALGRMLRLKHRESDWLSVKESEIWELAAEGRELAADGSGILPALRLSYDSLPSYLRQCFGFCSIFPKDSEMDKSQLIELWIANGFVPPQGQRELREIGDEIFLELSWRSFFQDVTEDKNGTVTCKMHDLIHDLAISIMRFECYMFDNNKPVELPKKIRHLHIPFHTRSMDANPAEKMCSLVKSCSSVRSLVLGHNFLTPAYFSALEHARALDCRGFPTPKSLGKMIHLRYLNIRCYRGTRVPKSIGNLVHLTYLNLCESSIERLPMSIIFLQNLQILKLSRCYRLRELPQGMKHMRSLKCVDISHCDALKRTPPGIGHLTQLVELSTFIVRKDDGCGIGELEELDLGKELCIRELDNVTGSTEAKSANLIRKQNLRSLSLIWGKHAGKFPDKEEKVLSCLQPHSNLEYLRMCCYQGSRLPNWMIDVPNLVSIEFHQCKRCTHLPPLGELPLLKFLKIGGMDAVKCISSEFYGNRVDPFPSLEKLNFDSMPILETWKTVEGRGNFPHLQIVTFKKCPNLIELPTIPIVKRLHISGSIFYFEAPDDLGSLMIRDLSSSTIIPKGLLQNQTHLEELRIESSPNLKSLSNQLDNLSVLKRLDIFSCDKLEDIPEAVQNLNSLKRLDLYLCNSLVSFPVNGLHGLTSLRILNISSCERFASLSDGVMHLTQLEKLCLDDCPMLKFLPEEIQQLSALKKLRIDGCKRLTSVPNQIQHLTSLSELCIDRCPMLNSLPAEIQHLSAVQKLTVCCSVPNQIEHLTSLSELCIANCPMSNSLPVEIQHLSALQKLEISCCDGLTSVPNQIEHLSSLSELYISCCPNLMSLPQGLQSLTTLKTLLIEECQHLEKRCKKEGGEDWPNIAHIPSINIIPCYEGYQNERRSSNGSLLTRFGDWTYGLSSKFFKRQPDS